MSKINMIEMEENINYDEDMAEQERLRIKYEMEEKERKIEEAKQLLLRNGYIVRLLHDEVYSSHYKE